MKRARALRRGDTIGIAAPSSPFDKGLFQKGVRAIESLGFEARFRKDIFDQNRYFAGTEQRRADELMELFADDGIAAVMFARGGYGSQRVIPLLDAAAIAARPKPVVGFSDITALLTFLRQSAHIPTLYGPVVTQLGRDRSHVTMESLLRALTSHSPIGEISAAGANVMKPGRASGRLVGGCLTLINSSIGTPYEMDTEGAVLFIEDTGEKIYVLDRMLTQLRASGALSRARALLIGNIIPPDGERHDMEAMFMDVLADFKGPVVDQFPAGHSDEFVTLPLGVEVEIDAPAEGAPKITFTEALLP
ncbi:MAG: LD-carboxypeptidase [Proteobacteria bacterium]|nr:LD-carboxypeptidase [Pseudomonadota bacterium]